MDAMVELRKKYHTLGHRNIDQLEFERITSNSLKHHIEIYEKITDYIDVCNCLSVAKGGARGVLEDKRKEIENELLEYFVFREADPPPEGQRNLYKYVST